MSQETKEDIRLEISMDRQELEVLRNGKTLRTFPISTSEKGMGFTEGSFRTPTGNFEISEKIGDGEPLHTRFVARVPQGVWDPTTRSDEDLILTRILRLDGKDPENSNTRERYVYIHGTNREDLIGKPASHGCIRLPNTDMMELFDLVPEGVPVRIEPLTKSTVKLLFLDCDSTLSAIEGIDELARLSGTVIFQEVVSLTNSAMNGEIPLEEVFGKRMAIIKPHMDMVSKVSQRYLDTIVDGVEAFIGRAKSEGWLPVILSGGFAPLIDPLADRLQIRHVEAVPLYFNDLGDYIGYGEDYPTTRNLGKNEIIREWKKALVPEQVVMIGDGISDLETKPDVDLMIGYGGVVSRDKVREGADLWIRDFNSMESLDSLLSRRDT